MLWNFAQVSLDATNRAERSRVM